MGGRSIRGGGTGLISGGMNKGIIHIPTGRELGFTREGS